MTRRRKRQKSRASSGGPSPQEKALYRLILARSDLESARTTCEYAISEGVDITNPLWMPLHDAALIAYARPFTANEPFGSLPNRWGKFEDDTLQTLHDELLDLRNKTIAHSDGAIRKVIVIPAGVPSLPHPEGANRPTVAVRNVMRAPTLFPDLKSLCLNLGLRIHETVEAELESLSGGSIRVAPYDLETGESVSLDTSGAVVLKNTKSPFSKS